MIAFRGGSENKALSRISEALGPGVTGYHCTILVSVFTFSLRDRATDRHENSTGDIALTWCFISRLGRCVSPPLTATGPVVNERDKGVMRFVGDLSSRDASEINATTQLEAACGPLLRTEASSFFIQAPKSSALPKALFLSDGKISSCARHRRLWLRPRIGSPFMILAGAPRWNRRA